MHHAPIYKKLVHLITNKPLTNMNIRMLSNINTCVEFVFPDLLGGFLGVGRYGAIVGQLKHPPTVYHTITGLQVTVGSQGRLV